MEYLKILLLSNHTCISLLQNSLPWSTHNLFGLWLDLCTISIKVFKTVLHFLSFTDLMQAYLVKASITNNKYQTLFS